MSKETNEPERVLVIRTLTYLESQDYIKMRDRFIRQLKDGVVLLDRNFEFCCVAAADDVYIMHDDLFPCDPDKADGCSKTFCYRNGGECQMTTREEWRRKRGQL